MLMVCLFLSHSETVSDSLLNTSSKLSGLMLAASPVLCVCHVILITGLFHCPRLLQLLLISKPLSCSHLSEPYT